MSVLDESGFPGIVDGVLISTGITHRPTDASRAQCLSLQRSPYQGRYDSAVDRQSAYEILRHRSEKKVQAETRQPQRKSRKSSSSGGRQRQGVFEALTKSAARAVGSSLGRQIVRGIPGSITVKF